METLQQAMDKHIVTVENAALFKDWLANRGGIAVWPSVNLANPDASWSTPALTTEGQPSQRPTPEAAASPSRIITDINDVAVAVDREVKRFRVAVRVGAQGFMMKCTDASTRRIRKEVLRAGDGAYYEFDYGTQEAVIYAPERTVPLAEWRAV